MEKVFKPGDWVKFDIKKATPEGLPEGEYKGEIIEINGPTAIIKHSMYSAYRTDVPGLDHATKEEGN